MNPFSPNQLIQIIVSYPLLYHFFSNLKTKETFSKIKTLFYQPYQVFKMLLQFRSQLLDKSDFANQFLLLLLRTYLYFDV